MADEPASGAPRVVLPERLDRRMRLGPFPSVGQALKFAGYTAVGAFAASIFGPAGWLPFVGFGFLAATYRSEGRAPDERLAEYLAYGLRRLRPEVGSSDPGLAMTGTGSFRSAAGPRVALLVAGGVPVAFLPQEDARRLFEGFLRALSGTEASLYLVAGLATIRDRPLRPRPDLGAGGAADAAARAGYAEMVSAVARSRARRRVTIAVWAPGSNADEEVRLERAVHRLVEALRQVEVPVRRLEGRALAVEAARIGLVGRPQ